MLISLEHPTTDSRAVRRQVVLIPRVDLKFLILDNPPEIEPHGSAKNGIEFLDPMTDENHCRIGPRWFPKQIGECLATVGIKIGCRFVKEHDRAVSGKGKRSKDLLLHAAGELVKRLVPMVFDFETELMAIVDAQFLVKPCCLGGKFE